MNKKHFIIFTSGAILVLLLGIGFQHILAQSFLAGDELYVAGGAGIDGHLRIYDFDTNLYTEGGQVLTDGGTINAGTGLIRGGRAELYPGNNQEGLYIMSSNFSPLAIVNSNDNTMFRINQNSQASGLSTVIAGPSGGSSANSSKIPLLNSSGLIDTTLLPFNKGDIIAPGDRSLISGLGSYLTEYFRINNLGISGASASQVCSSATFGPNNSISGNASCGGACIPAGNDADGDSYKVCTYTFGGMRGADCNDGNSFAYMGSAHWGPDPERNDETGTWQCGYPTYDYNCNNTVEKRWRVEDEPETFYIDGEIYGWVSGVCTLASFGNCGVLVENCGTDLAPYNECYSNSSCTTITGDLRVVCN